MCTNSGVPAERVTALRRAFDATMKDPEFLAEAKKQTLMIHSMTGEKSEEIVASIVNAPAAVINKVRDAVTSGSAAAEQRRKKKK
jgi:tripartite-type tricarboxylate transporter receptor subunit TctC